MALGRALGSATLDSSRGSGSDGFRTCESARMGCCLPLEEVIEGGLDILFPQKCIDVETFAKRLCGNADRIILCMCFTVCMQCVCVCVHACVYVNTNLTLSCISLQVGRYLADSTANIRVVSNRREASLMGPRCKSPDQFSN